MYDKRVVRGNTYAAQILPAVRAAALAAAHMHHHCKLCCGIVKPTCADLYSSQATIVALP